LKRPDEKLASKSRNANFSQEEKLLLAELGKLYPDIENKGYDNVSLKRRQSSWEKVSTPEIPMVTKIGVIIFF